MLALPLSPLLSILLGVFELGLWGVLQKIAVLNTHCIVRSTDKQCAAWISRVLGRATNWVTLVTGLIHECLQPDLGLAAPSLPVASTLPPGKKLQTLSLGACGLKDKSKAFIPCSPHPAAAMWPVHRSSAFPAVAPGIQKYRLLWDRSILSWMDSINCCMETAQANSLPLSCPDMSEFSPGKLIMDLPRCLRIASHVQVSLLRSFSPSVFWSFYRFFSPGTGESHSLHSPAGSSEINFLESSWSLPGRKQSPTRRAYPEWAIPICWPDNSSAFQPLTQLCREMLRQNWVAWAIFSYPFVAIVWGGSKEVLGTFCCAGSFEICSEQWCSNVGVYQTSHGLHHYSCHCI